jgi:hypothetical protein
MLYAMLFLLVFIIFYKSKNEFLMQNDSIKVSWIPPTTDINGITFNDMPLYYKITLKKEDGTILEETITTNNSVTFKLNNDNNWNDLNNHLNEIGPSWEGKLIADVIVSFYNDSFDITNKIQTNKDFEHDFTRIEPDTVREIRIERG